ncbi:MAG TPA: ZIP family metal transporter [Candidatus Pacearchaeota archaeon]|nr:ZIP family metal transporter [Candidatus Parcubacteria bacterium]HOU46026.1 ZIP family metal transporter [Candidatus Pacearchaeota archaeon]HQI74758.1 ZIP family metal transporter [Candidatus Pacearchaeota archaeon]
MGIIYPIIATLIVSAISLVGIFSLLVKKDFLEKILLIFVAFSAGSMIGSAFFDLIPEAMQYFQGADVFIYVILGFSIFFLLEKIFYWRHCHHLEGDCKFHMFTYMNLLGDGFHNFIDGMLIAVSFFADIKLGITTTLAVLLHEIPQEIGDFSVLIYGGMKKGRALLLNLLSALFAVLGAIVAWKLSQQVDYIAKFLIPFAAGGFIYISASDLVPELHKENTLSKSIASYLFFLIGILFMYFAGFFVD